VARLFRGQLFDVLRCRACGHTRVRRDHYEDLDLAIVSRPAAAAVSHVQDAGVGVSLAQCIDGFCALETLAEGNRVTCDSEACGGTKREAEKHISLVPLPGLTDTTPDPPATGSGAVAGSGGGAGLPEVLCFQLKRFVFDRASCAYKKLFDPVLIPLRLSATGAAASAPGADSSDSWYLSAILMHTGTAVRGHYFAFVGHPRTDGAPDPNASESGDLSSPFDWFCANDDAVVPLRLQDMAAFVHLCSAEESSLGAAGDSANAADEAAARASALVPTFSAADAAFSATARDSVSKDVPRGGVPYVLFYRKLRNGDSGKKEGDAAAASAALAALVPPSVCVEVERENAAARAVAEALAARNALFVMDVIGPSRAQLSALEEAADGSVATGGEEPLPPSDGPSDADADPMTRLLARNPPLTVLAEAKQDSVAVATARAFELWMQRLGLSAAEAGQLECRLRFFDRSRGRATFPLAPDAPTADSTLVAAACKQTAGDLSLGKIRQLGSVDFADIVVALEVRRRASDGAKGGAGAEGAGGMPWPEYDPNKLTVRVYRWTPELAVTLRAAVETPSESSKPFRASQFESVALSFPGARAESMTLADLQEAVSDSAMDCPVDWQRIVIVPGGLGRFEDQPQETSTPIVRVRYDTPRLLVSGGAAATDVPSPSTLLRQLGIQQGDDLVLELSFAPSETVVPSRRPSLSSTNGLELDLERAVTDTTLEAFATLKAVAKDDLIAIICIYTGSSRPSEDTPVRTGSKTAPSPREVTVFCRKRNDTILALKQLAMDALLNEHSIGPFEASHVHLSRTENGPQLRLEDSRLADVDISNGAQLYLIEGALLLPNQLQITPHLIMPTRPKAPLMALPALLAFQEWKPTHIQRYVVGLVKNLALDNPSDWPVLNAIVGGAMSLSAEYLRLRVKPTVAAASTSMAAALSGTILREDVNLRTSLQIGKAEASAGPGCSVDSAEVVIEILSAPEPVTAAHNVVIRSRLYRPANDDMRQPSSLGGLKDVILPKGEGCTLGALIARLPLSQALQQAPTTSAFSTPMLPPGELFGAAAMDAFARQQVEPGGLPVLTPIPRFAKVPSFGGPISAKIADDLLWRAPAELVGADSEEAALAWLLADAPLALRDNAVLLWRYDCVPSAAGSADGATAAPSGGIAARKPWARVTGAPRQGDGDSDDVFVSKPPRKSGALVIG
jgi:hypothetical protein